MIRLTETQMSVVDELAAISNGNKGRLYPEIVESYDEDTVDLLFRSKVLKRDGGPKGTSCYRLDTSIILANDPEKAAIQAEEIKMDILLKLAQMDARDKLMQVRTAALKVAKKATKVTV
jgi:hypothetical protein